MIEGYDSLTKRLLKEFTSQTIHRYRFISCFGAVNFKTIATEFQFTNINATTFFYWRQFTK